VERITERESVQRSPRVSQPTARVENLKSLKQLFGGSRDRAFNRQTTVQVATVTGFNDRLKRFGFSNFVREASPDEHFASRLVFSDEAAFRSSGTVNRRDVRILGYERPFMPQSNARFTF